MNPTAKIAAAVHIACSISRVRKPTGGPTPANRTEHLRSFISSAIRRKLGIDRHETNIGIYVRKLLKNM